MSPGVRSSSPMGTSPTPYASSSAPRPPRASPEGARGRREARRAAGLRVHMRHGQRQVGRGEPVEPDSRRPWAAVRSRRGCARRRPSGRCARGRSRTASSRLALAEQRRDRRLVGELGAVVGEHGANTRRVPVGAWDRPGRPPGRPRRTRRSSPPAAARAGAFRWAVRRREQAGGVLQAPSTVSISQAAAHARPPEGEERGMRPAGGVAGRRLAPARLLGL